MRIADDITHLVGGTPLVGLRSLVPDGGAGVLAKLEFFNPADSVKDRIAVSMIDDAEKRGLLKPGTRSSSPRVATPALRSRWSAPRAVTSRSSRCPKR